MIPQNGRSPQRLPSGTLFYPGGDGRWRLAGPNDAFTVVAGPADLLAAAQPVLHGLDPPPAEPEVARLVADFAHRGLLAPDVAGPVQSGPIYLDLAGTSLARNSTAVGVRGLLEAAGIEVIVLDPPIDGPACWSVPPPDDAAAIVSVAGWLPDTHWRTVDSWCAARSVPWHRTHLESTAVAVGPVCIEPDGLRYEDLRGRRLAAAAAPDELEGLWAYLGSAPALPEPAWPSPPGAALAAAILATDVLAVLSGATPPTIGHQVVVDPATATTRWHRVLPLPGRLHRPSLTRSRAPAVPATVP